MTKIQKESNSQRKGYAGLQPLWCCGLWQRYKKKAIHNAFFWHLYIGLGVVAYDKDTKRKQFTTQPPVRFRFGPVLWPMTKIQKESNSQLERKISVYFIRCCGLWQRYKKKAIHNFTCLLESLYRGVVAYDKDTKRKQFTTIYDLFNKAQRVLWPMTKIQKESNSQLLHSMNNSCERCCGLWQRYKKKAIHNVANIVIFCFPGVVAYDKDTKRKQFTT